MPSPHFAPKVCALLDGNHDIELLASGDMCLRRVSIPRRLCALIYRGAFVPLSFRVIALLPSHYRSVARFSYLLTRGCIFEGITPAA